MKYLNELVELAQKYAGVDKHNILVSAEGLRICGIGQRDGNVYIPYAKEYKAVLEICSFNKDEDELLFYLYQWIQKKQCEIDNKGFKNFKVTHDIQIISDDEENTHELVIEIELIEYVEMIEDNDGLFEHENRRYRIGKAKLDIAKKVAMF